MAADFEAHRMNAPFHCVDGAVHVNVHAMRVDSRCARACTRTRTRLRVCLDLNAGTCTRVGVGVGVCVCVSVCTLG